MKRSPAISMSNGASVLLMRSFLFVVGTTIAFSLATIGDEPNGDPFPTTSSKKGLQVQMIDDALALGIQHAALNVNLTQLVDPAARDGSLRWTSDERTYTFDAAVIADLDRRVKQLSDQGVLVYLILLPYASGSPERDTLMLHPSYDGQGKNAGPIGMFNVATPQGKQWLTAVCEFLAARYSVPGPHGRVWGYIAGNEVNSHWFWANMGRAQPEQVVVAYEESVRRIHAAVRKSSLQARVYLSLEHCWAERYAGGDELQCMPGRNLLRDFAALARKNGDFDWHLAYHPYPEPLTDCRFWQDLKHSPQSPDATTVTFRNLEVLLAFCDKPELQWQGKSRRVILSEQGFHCRRENMRGEREQAAAYALAWRKVAQLPAIDAFILHRHVDHAHEGGLKLGLWTNRPGSVATPDRKRLMYEVFRAAGTADEEQAFAFALPVIGAPSWEEALADLKK